MGAIEAAILAVIEVRFRENERLIDEEKFGQASKDLDDLETIVPPTHKEVRRLRTLLKCRRREFDEENS